jgi:hypothetical protein
MAMQPLSTQCVPDKLCCTMLQATRIEADEQHRMQRGLAESHTWHLRKSVGVLHKRARGSVSLHLASWQQRGLAVAVLGV